MNGMEPMDANWMIAAEIIATLERSGKRFCDRIGKREWRVDARGLGRRIVGGFECLRRQELVPELIDLGQEVLPFPDQ